MVQRAAVVAAILALSTIGHAQTGLRLTYLGTAGWEISDGKTVVLVDPYLTRAKYVTPTDPPDPNDMRPFTTGGDVVPSDTKTIDAHVTRADVILMTHGHPDHTLDLAYIAKKTGATVVGTQGIFNLEKALGVADRQLKVVVGHESLTFGDVVITPIPSRHGMMSLPLSLTEAGNNSRVFAPDQLPPFNYGRMTDSTTMAYDVRIAGHEIVLFGSMNFNEPELTGFRPDIALIGAMPERSLIVDYTLRLMTVLGFPRLVLPTHWDAFNVPFGASQQIAIDRTRPFLAEVKAASPQSITFLPEHFKAIDVDALPNMTARRAGPPAAPIVKFYAGDLWLNLHHFLYILGRAQNSTVDSTRPEVAGAIADQQQGLAKLPPNEQQMWRDAVSAYAADLSKRDVVFDSDMVAITRAITALGDVAAPDGPTSTVPVAVSAILRKAAAAYRRAWWPAHHRENLAWMSETRGLVDRHGPSLLAFITHAYQLPWPAAGYPVHVVAYANWAGAYSTDGPMIVISSLDDPMRGPSALETVFHETMHQWDGPVDAKLKELARTAGKTVTQTTLDSLTHAMIWMTAGEAVHRVIPNYVPFADANGLWLRGANPRLKPVLESSWLPFLRGAGTRDDALAAIVSAMK